MTTSRSLIVLMFTLMPMLATAEGALREVTVTGRAEVRVVPDEVVLSFAVETMNEDLGLAKQENDRIATAALEAVQRFGLGADHVKTDYMKIEPMYTSGRSGMRELLGYRVANSIVVTSQDITLVEDLLSALLEAGVNKVTSVDFRTTEFRKHRDRAMLMALDAARDKATAMSEHLGSKIGRPISISEGPASLRPGLSNAIQSSATGGGGIDGPLAPGELAIPAVATVTFELLD